MLVNSFCRYQLELFRLEEIEYSRQRGREGKGVVFITTLIDLV